MAQRTWQQRLKDVLRENRLSMKALSLKAGLSESAVRDAVNRGREPSVENFIKMAEAAGVSPGYLLQGDERFRLHIPLIGFTTKGEDWAPLEQNKKPAATTEFALKEHDIVAIEVRGDGMSPVYRDGDQLFCQRRTGSYVDNLVGLDCVLRTTAGDHHIKILAKGTRPGTFNLRSYNPVFKDIENVPIEWAAPIIWIKRGGR